MICNNCRCETGEVRLQQENWVCPECGKYFFVPARERINLIADKGCFREWDKDIVEIADSGEAIVTGETRLNGTHIAIGVMDTSCMLASMGYVVGEKVTRLFEKARIKRIPVVLFCCSGGARIQEGVTALMQMEKTSAAVRKHSNAGLLYIAVLTHPTMGGVAASFATAADVVIAEKGAKIGFAGPRIIEQNYGEKLPKGYQTAEFHLIHGYVDEVVSRSQVKNYLIKLLALYKRKSTFDFGSVHHTAIPEFHNGVVSLDTWDIVRKARSVNRPTSFELINGIFDSFVELHGDRIGDDDHALIGGLASICGKTVMVVASQKGKKNLSEAIYRNWGMASPGGYRKALRLVKQAEKFNQPVIFFIDTIGAACGKKAEENGQIHAISKMLSEMSTLRVPVLSIIHGEAGSGGALALGVANEVWIFENAIYSVITPESYASIKWKNSSKAAEASKIMNLTSKHLLNGSFVDKIISEPTEWNQNELEDFCLMMKREIACFINKYRIVLPNLVVKRRYKRYRDY